MRGRDNISGANFLYSLGVIVAGFITMFLVIDFFQITNAKETLDQELKRSISRELVGIDIDLYRMLLVKDGLDLGHLRRGEGVADIHQGVVAPDDDIDLLSHQLLADGLDPGPRIAHAGPHGIDVGIHVARQPLRRDKERTNMGAQIRVYRQKIASTTSMGKIFKAMELIASSRIGKARARVSASLPYANAITRAVTAVASQSEVEHPLTTEPESIRRAAVLVLTADRGLAGSYSAGVLKQATTRSTPWCWCAAPRRWWPCTWMRCWATRKWW